MGVIKHILKSLDKNILNKLYKSLVRPIMEYPTSVWCLYLRRDISTLERAHHQANKL